ncbi:hypothetical protein M2273_005181 [Mucilaginibacter lappiensis]
MRFNTHTDVQRQVRFTGRETDEEPINFPACGGTFVSFIAKTDNGVTPLSALHHLLFSSFPKAQNNLYAFVHR